MRHFQNQLKFNTKIPHNFGTILCKKTEFGTNKSNKWLTKWTKVILLLRNFRMKKIIRRNLPNIRHLRKPILINSTTILRRTS
uniref:Ovule protein n=1 Tax=Globodera rostochiensis TaxID=31243 RepID=A0A914H862_GLORO